MKNYDYQNENTDYTSPGPGPSPGPVPDGQNRPSRNIWETISWVVDVGLIFVWFPVGLFLTIAHSMGHDFVGMLLDMMRGVGAAGKKVKTDYTTVRDEIHRGTSTSRRKGVKTEPGPEEAEPAAQTANKAPARAGLRRADAGAKVRTVFGWILAVFGIVGALAMAGSSVWGALTYGAVALGGGAMVVSASMSRKKEAKFKRLLTVSGTEGLVALDKLARTMGVDKGALCKALTEMIDRGYYGPEAYIDHERGLLVIQPFAMRDVYRAEDMARAARQAQEEADTAREAEEAGVGQEYARILAQIRQADEDIDDEAMSEKIRRMLTITAAIFREVEAHPEKKPQIRRFLNYYLPTTLKLLDNYARIEDRGVTGQNMAKAKADIEGIADTLVAGYEKQLDTLYSAEAMDIAGDVSVIENMMKHDGLTGKSDFGPGQTAGGT